MFDSTPGRDADATVGVPSFDVQLPDSPADPAHDRLLRCVFIDASLYYVDQRGEHSGLLSEATDLEEQRSRLRTVSNDERWLRAAVELGDAMIDLARRSGDTEAWGCTSGHFGGSNPGPNRMMHAIKSVTGRVPPKPAVGPMARPEQGRWSVRRVFSYERGKVAPSVAIWHLGFTQNPQFFPRWCAAIGAGARVPVHVLPDSPIMRELARRWNAGELVPRRQQWRPDGVRDYLGSAAHLRPRLSGAVDVDGSEIDGVQLAAALVFLEARHQLRISPFDLLHDSLLAAQLDPVEVEADDRPWSPREQTTLALLRKRYDRPQRVHAWLAEARRTPPTDVFGKDDATYASSVEECLRTAERAVETGEIAPVLISSWTGWAPSALDRGERPEVPARSDWHGRLVEWYRQTFALAVGYKLIDAEWFRAREVWHANAYQTFPGELGDYYRAIHIAEDALTSEPEGRNSLVSEAALGGWYRGVFDSAVQLGLVGAGGAGDARS